jgi:hypothetical protein
MQLWQMIAIAVIVAVIIVAAGWMIYSQRRSRYLRDRFGPEYDRTITEFGNRGRAEAELAHREQRVRNLKIRPLSYEDRQNFRDRWRQTQALFVDDPPRAVDEADKLLTDIMRTRGYAADNAYDRVADVSAAYPQHAANYRLAGEIVSRHHRGYASTEDLRAAFIHYRALFDDILGGQDEELKRAS